MDDRAAALSLVDVSHETLARLDTFAALLVKWQSQTNLIASSTLPALWTRHIADSLQLTRLAPDAATWLDIGSGGGFPGIVLACAFADDATRHVHLVERNAKKVAFLREALRVTGGAGSVYLGDIADCAARLPADIGVVTARAVAPLHALIEMAHPWLDKGATGLFPKGQDLGSELQDTPISGMFHATFHLSLTGGGTIVEINRRKPCADRS